MISEKRLFLFICAAFFSLTNLISAQTVYTRELNKTISIDALAYKGDGSIFATSGWNGPTIYKITPNNEVTSFVKGLKGVVDLTWGINDTLLGSSYQDGQILKISPSGNVENFAFVGNGAASLFTDNNGDYLVTINPGLAHPSKGSVKRITPGGKVSTFASGGTINKPSGIAKDSYGNYYISNLGDGRITKIDKNGNKELFATIPKSGKWTIGYLKLWKGNLYATNISSNSVYKITLDGDVELFSGTGSEGEIDGEVDSAKWINPNGMTISGDTLFVTRGIGLTNKLRYIVDNNATNVDEERSMNHRIKLNQNFPNPFNPQTVISYVLSMNSKVTLKVFDLQGSEIKTLINRSQPQGIYNVTFNANELASGLYIYQLKAGKFVDSKKMILLK